MALQSLGSLLYWPPIGYSTGGSVAVGNRTTLDGAGDYDAFVFCAAEDMTISHVGARFGAATGSPTVDIRIETVTAGVPSGTLWATNTSVNTGTITSNTWGVYALTASATITKGQIVAVKLAYSSGTSVITQGITNFSQSPGRGLPLLVTNTSGSDTKAAVSQTLILALGSGATTFYRVTGILPAESSAANTFNNTSSAMRGMRFKIPFRCRVVGLRYHYNNATGNFNALLLSDAGVELNNSSTTIGGTHPVAITNGITEVYFDNPVTIEPNAWYRAAIEPSSSTNQNITTIAMPSTSNIAAAWPAGTFAHYTTYTSGGGWVDSATTTMPLMEVIVDKIDMSPAHIIGG